MIERKRIAVTYEIPAPRTIELDAWLNVYRDGSICEHKTKEQADREAAKNRFACINLKRPVTEGEGL